MKHKIWLLLLLLPGCFPGCPGYVYMRESEGDGEYAAAERTRKVKILEAQAALESAKFLADAEVARAEGVAKANKIIGESLKDNEAYLKWLWIKGLEDNGQQKPQVIYVPTEAGLPILEAGHRGFEEEKGPRK